MYHRGLPYDWKCWELGELHSVDLHVTVHRHLPVLAHLNFPLTLPVLWFWCALSDVLEVHFIVYSANSILTSRSAACFLNGKEERAVERKPLSRNLGCNIADD